MEENPNLDVQFDDDSG